MPTLNIEQFDHEPSVGDMVKIEGKIKSINPDSGEVDVTYDKVSTMNSSQGTEEGMQGEDQGGEDSMNLDDALKKSFNYTE